MSNRNDKKQDWRSSDSELKSGAANTPKASDAATDKRGVGKHKGPQTATQTEAKTRSADSIKNRDQRR